MYVWNFPWKRNITFVHNPVNRPKVKFYTSSFFLNSYFLYTSFSSRYGETKYFFKYF